MFINPTPPLPFQGMEELQGVEESAEGTITNPEHTFENTLFAVEGETTESLKPQEELAEEFILKTGIMSEEQENGGKESSPSNGREILQIAALPMASLKPALQAEESVLKTAPVEITKDHAQMSTLPQEDGVSPLNSPVVNMPQPEDEVSPLNSPVVNMPQPEDEVSPRKSPVVNMPQPEDEVSPRKSPVVNMPKSEKESIPSISNANIHSVLQPVEAEEAETLHKSDLVQHDPRIRLGENKTPERTPVTVEAQLEQANFQIGVESSGKVTPKSDAPTILTTAAVMHSVENEPQAEMIREQLKQQFRQIPANDSLETDQPQPLREFSQNMNFDASVNPSGKKEDFEAQKTISKNAVQRNIPEMAEVFTAKKKEELTETSQTSTDMDSQVDRMMTESREKTDTAPIKEGRAISELNTTRTVSKETPIDLEQIMSKVNVKDEGTREVTLQLTPRDLGQMKMKIRQEGNEISVEMIVANPEVKQVLEANLPELRARFLAQEDASFDQLQFAVDVEQHQFSGQSSEHGDFQEDYLSNQQEREVESNLPASEQYRKAGFNSGVSVYV